mmetsp:Transcript_9067/g.34209  ORF Transcript_9067/g.34209 Transcript_9067/m.34209 type:complete len:411 (-) Transcript_9067:256-1488(-)
MEQALPVSGSRMEALQRYRTGSAPTTAEEYLMRVRVEAEHLPGVLSAPARSANRAARGGLLKHFRTVPKCPEGLRAPLQWKRSALAQFVDLRQYLRRWLARGMGSKARGRRIAVPPLKDGWAWRCFCLGPPEGSAAEDGQQRPRAPGAELLLQFDQVLIRRLLEHHVSWLLGDEPTPRSEVHHGEEGPEALPNGNDDKGEDRELRWPRKRKRAKGTASPFTPSSAETPRPKPLSRARAVWLYAMLARLERPLDANGEALVRQLYLALSTLRAGMATSAKRQTSPQATEADRSYALSSATAKHLASINLLITITGQFFGQAGTEEERVALSECDEDGVEGGQAMDGGAAGEDAHMHIGFPRSFTEAADDDGEAKEAGGNPDAEDLLSGSLPGHNGWAVDMEGIEELEDDFL